MRNFKPTWGSTGSVAANVLGYEIVLQWTTTHELTSVRWKAKTYIHPSCVDNGCRLEDLPKNDDWLGQMVRGWVQEKREFVLLACDDDNDDSSTRNGWLGLRHKNLCWVFFYTAIIFLQYMTYNTLPRKSEKTYLVWFGFIAHQPL